MTHTFAAYECLAAGGKTTRELAGAMHWSFNQARKALSLLMAADQIRRSTRPGFAGYVYEAAR